MKSGLTTLLIAAWVCGAPVIHGQAPSFQNLFHLAGVPGLRSEARVDMVSESDALLFQAHKVHYEVPYRRIQQVILLRSDRRYEGRTYLAAMVTPYAAGSLLILKKHHMDTAVLNYVNERGGKMGIVVQMEISQGQQFREFLASKNIPVTEPAEAPAVDSAGKQPGAAMTTNPSSK